MVGNILGILKDWGSNLMMEWNREFRADYEAIFQFKGKHAGETCVVLCNGPSLNEVDFQKISPFVVFGMNRFYLLPEEKARAVDYCVVFNPLLLEQWPQDFEALNIPIFLRSSSRGLLANRSQFFIHRRRGDFVRFQRNVARGVWKTPTVTFVALQLAYFMGFTRVILVGADHEFQQKGKPGTLVTESSGDKNHFSPDYFGPGSKWQLPDLESSEDSYQKSRKAYEKSKREVFNATAGGRLEIFIRRALEDVT